MKRSGASGPDRRAVALGVAAVTLGGFGGQAPRAQTAGIEILAAGSVGEGQDQLARAIAEGLWATQLTPRAIAANVPRDVQGIDDFVNGARPRAAMMVIGLSSIGALVAENAIHRLDACRPLARLIGEPLPIVTQAGAPYRGLGDLVDALAKNPESVTFAGRGRGSADHQLVLMLARAAGVEPGRLSYTPAETSARVSANLLAGKAMVATGALPEFLQQIKGGTLKALAVATPERLPGLEIPTMVEQNVNVTLVNWRGVVTRSGTGTALTDRLAQALERLNALEGWRQLLSRRHWIDMHEPADAFARFLAAERTRVQALLRDVAID